MTPFIEDKDDPDGDDLKTRLIACLQRVGLDTESAVNWDLIVHDSNIAAANEIYGALLSRGYTSAQVAAWDRGREFNIDIGLYWCLVKGGVTNAYDPTFINALDRRFELLGVFVTIDDEVPDEDADGGIAFGMLTNAADTFTMDSKV